MTNAPELPTATDTSMVVTNVIVHEIDMITITDAIDTKRTIQKAVTKTIKNVGHAKRSAIMAKTNTEMIITLVNIGIGHVTVGDKCQQSHKKFVKKLYIFFYVSS